MAREAFITRERWPLPRIFFSKSASSFCPSTPPRNAINRRVHGVNCGDTRHNDSANASPSAAPAFVHPISHDFPEFVENNHISIEVSTPVAIELARNTTALVFKFDTMANVYKRNEGADWTMEVEKMIADALYAGPKFGQETL